MSATLPGPREVTPLYALVGAADLALEGARQVPGAVLGRALGAVRTVGATYDDLAARGRTLVERIAEQPATKDLAGQTRATVRLTRAAATTARRTAAEVAASSRETLAAGRRQAATVATDPDASVERAAAGTKAAAARTTRTARKRAGDTAGAAKGAARSTRRTAKAAEQAVEDAAGTVEE